MVGTEHALKVILGIDISGPATLDVGRSRAHVFDCMALVNSTLCSRAGHNSSGQGSASMFNECRQHLAATMTILEPTIVTAQGWSRATARSAGPSVANTVAAALDVSAPQTDPHLTVTTMPWGKVAVVTAYHPARHWSAPTTPYWARLESVLRAAREAIVL